MTQLNIFDPKPNPLQLLFQELAGEPTDGLRYYQRECRSKIDRALEKRRSTLVVMATGLGKTVIFVSTAKLWPGPVLILAHRDELIAQAKAELEAMTGEKVGVEKGHLQSKPEHRLVVGSVQSFNRERLERLGPLRFSLIIVDEAHHSVARSYKRIFEFFAGAKVLGVTATPDRGDKLALGQIFESVAYQMDIQDGVEAGYLVPIRGYRVILNIDLDSIKKTKGDLDEGELDRRMAENVDAIVKETIRIGGEKSAICFFPGRTSAEMAAVKFNDIAPGTAAYVDGYTNDDTRAAIMAAFKQGRIRYLCNCQIATEGFDAPNASLIVLARPTLSRALYAQMIGRGTRVRKGIVDWLHGESFYKERRDAIAKSLKPDCTVLDFVGNSQKHDLVTLVDVLGGRYTDAEVKEAKRKVKGGDNVLVSLEEARERLRTVARETNVKVDSVVVAFDPFSVLGLSISDNDRYSLVGRFGAKAAHPGQLATLAKWGMQEKDISQLSFRGAKRLIDKCLARRAAGLCTYKQLAVLQKYGITERDIPMGRATAALDYIAMKKGWPNNPHGRTKMGTVEPHVLIEIIHHRRASGED